MRFGEFLVSQGHLTTQQVATALIEQRRRTVPLGRLALQSGVLQPAAVHRVLRAQAQERPWRAFGDVARGLGLLQSDQVDELVSAQQKHRPRLGQVLVEHRLLSTSAQDRLVRAFRAARDAADAAPAMTLAPLPH